MLQLQLTHGRFGDSGTEKNIRISTKNKTILKVLFKPRIGYRL